MLATSLRWSARLLSLVVIIFVVLSVFVPAGPPTRAQLVGLVFFPGLVCIGMALAWWHEPLGVLIATAGLAAFYAWSVISGAHFARGPWFVVCWSPTLLFAISWLLRRGRITTTFSA